MAPDYPSLPLTLVIQVAGSVIAGKRRGFRQDALRCVRGLAIKVMGIENMPYQGPGVIVFNHYSRLGFAAWWIALALSATLPVDLHWTMTSAWTEAGSVFTRLKALISERLFPRLALIYGFTAMPPMPPRPYEAAARARAVRQVLAVARRSPETILALAPEGQDSANGSLLKLHPGAGRFLELLNGLGCPFYPLGVFESSDALCLRFGPSFNLQLPPGLTSRQIDEQAAMEVMRAVAELLPEAMRGEYR